MVTYTLIWLFIAVGLWIFGFFLGRCARKLPFIDDRLPWTLSRDQVIRANRQSQRLCGASADKMATLSGMRSLSVILLAAS